MTRSEMINNNAWLGKFIALHEIGRYSLVEYKSKLFDGCTPKIPTEYAEKSSFSAYIDGQPINTSFSSLEEAIVGAIAYKYDGCNTKADTYFFKAILPYPTELFNID